MNAYKIIFLVHRKQMTRNNTIVMYVHFFTYIILTLTFVHNKYNNPYMYCPFENKLQNINTELLKI